MISLFKPNETSFEHNGLGSLDKNIINPVISEDLNGIFKLSFTYPIFAPHGPEIQGQSVVRAPVPGDEGGQLFRVYRPLKSMGYLEVSAYHIFYDLIDNFIEDTNVVGKNGQGAVQQILGATQYNHNFRGTSDISTTTNARLVRMNPVEALLDEKKGNSFVSRWGGELKRDNFNVRMMKNIGANRGKKIRHRKDLIGYEADVDFSSVVTRIMPQGFDGLLLPEKYIDSPLISSYVYPKIKKLEYSDIKAAIGEYADDEDAIPLEDALQLLREEAEKEYFVNKIDIPNATYRVDFVALDKTEEYKDLQDLQTILIGDIVTVIHEEDSLEIEAKMISYDYNPLDEKYLGITLGNFKNIFTDVRSETISLIDQLEETTKNTIQTAANGKNRIFRGVTEPNKGMMVNDLWYKPVGEGETMLYTWNGGIWELSKVSAGLLAGTLDAENGDVNLINVNVANIVGETSEFVRSNWNAINSSATIDGTGIRVVHSDGTYTKLGADGLKRFTAGDNRNYHYLMYATTFVYGDSSPSTARWIQLPDDFKGKDFDIFFAIADSLNAVDYFHSIQRFVCTQHPDFEIDYANARVPVIAYKSETQNDGLDPDITSVQGLMIALY